MPFDWSLFATLFRQAFSEDMSRRRRRVVWFSLLFFPLLATVNAACFLLDHILFPGFHRVAIRRPVFIVGHARSGTSLLHGLLAADNERFSWFAMYEMFLPSLLQRKAVRLAIRLDGRWLRGAIASRVEAWENRAFAAGRQMHPMSLAGPEEDEFLMAPCFCSSTLAMLFPYLRELQRYHRFDERTPVARRRRVMSFYRECVRRQLYLNGADRTHLSKNPVFSEKVESLIETFPDARFVVVVRNPFETIPSIMKMMSRNWKASDCRGDRVADSLVVLGENSVSSYLHPFEVLERHPETRWTTVRYEDLVERPRETVEAVYRDLDIERTPAVDRCLAGAEERSRAYRGEHTYTLEEFGLGRREIREQLAPLFERFGWAEPPPRKGAA